MNFSHAFPYAYLCLTSWTLLQCMYLCISYPPLVSISVFSICLCSLIIRSCSHSDQVPLALFLKILHVSASIDDCVAMSHSEEGPEESQ